MLLDTLVSYEAAEHPMETLSDRMLVDPKKKARPPRRSRARDSGGNNQYKMTCGWAAVLCQQASGQLKLTRMPFRTHKEQQRKAAETHAEAGVAGKRGKLEAKTSNVRQSFTKNV